MKLNIERPIWALGIIIAVIFGLYNCESAKNAKLELTAARIQVERADADKRARIAQKDAQIDSVVKTRKVDSLRYKVKLRASERVTAVWKKRALENRPQVLVLADSIPILKAYIAATDSVILSQDSTIHIQGEQINAQSASYLKEIALLGARHIQQQELTDVWKNHAVKTESQLKKEQRRKRFWKGASVIGTLVGFGAGAVLSQ